MEKRFPKSKRPKLLSKKSKQTLIKTAPTIHQIALQVDRKSEFKPLLEKNEEISPHQLSCSN